MFHMDDPNRGIVGGLGAGLMLGAIAWVTLTSGGLLPVPIVPALIMFLAGVALVLFAMRRDSRMGSVSSFIKLGKNAGITKSKINRNKSSADNFIEMGDDASIDEQTEIEDNEHTPQ